MLCSELLKHVDNLSNKYPEILNVTISIQYDGYLYPLKRSNLILKNLNHLNINCTRNYTRKFNFEDSLELINLTQILLKYSNKKLSLIIDDKDLGNNITYIGVHKFNHLIISLSDHLSSLMKSTIII